MKMRYPVLVSFLAVLCVASAYQGRGRGGSARPNIYPFFQISKAAGFDVVKADKASFIEMGAFCAMVGPDTVSTIKKPQNVVQLEYGFKKGGIGTVYETPKLPGRVGVLEGVIDARVFKDHQYFKGWCVAPVLDKKLFIIVSGTTPEVRDALIKALKH